MPSETPPSLPKRKRGAPLGNKNRYVHGAYARRPAPAPENESPSDRLSLTHEIGLLRAYLHRTAMLGALNFDLEQTLEILHALSLAATALTRLIHTEAWLRQTTGDQVQPNSLPSVLSSMDTMARKVLNLDSEPSGDQPSASQPAPAEAEVDPQLDALLKKIGLDPALLASALPLNPDPQRPPAPPHPGNGKLKPLKTPLGQ